MTPSPNRPTEPSRRRAPTPLLLAVVLVAVQGLLLVVYGVSELFALSGGRMAMGVTTGAFFLAYGVALAFCARALSRLRSWARAPVVLTELIALAVGWGFRGGSTTVVAALVMAAAVVVLVGIFHPASVKALSADA